MSQTGIRKAAALFEQMQLLRQELLSMGTIPNSVSATAGGKQDILLAQMLQIGDDAMKEVFCELTMMDIDNESH